VGKAYDWDNMFIRHIEFCICLQSHYFVPLANICDVEAVVFLVFVVVTAVLKKIIKLKIHLPLQSVPITTNVVSFIPVLEEV
jgi:hypothetical protein